MEWLITSSLDPDGGTLGYFKASYIKLIVKNKNNQNTGQFPIKSRIWNIAGVFGSNLLWRFAAT
jgi:hypothetical protein